MKYKLLFMNHKIIFINILLLFCSLSVAQFNDSLKELFQSNRKGRYLHNEITSWLKENHLPKDKLLTYSEDKKEVDMPFLFSLVYYEAMYSEKVKVKEDNVSFLIRHGLLGGYLPIESTVTAYLNDFSPTLFSAHSKSVIASKVRETKVDADQLIRLSGKLAITDLIPYLDSILVDEKREPSLKWSAQLALGRMGDVTKVKECVERVRRIGMNDQVVFDLMPDLLYLRNRIAYDYILHQILSDEEKCTSANPDHEHPLNCAYRLIELIAPYIKDFPVKIYESGDLITDSYLKTLKVVQDWILSNNYMYELSSE